MVVEVAFYRALGKLHAGGEIGGQGRPNASDIVVLDGGAEEEGERLGELVTNDCRSWCQSGYGDSYGARTRRIRFC